MAGPHLTSSCPDPAAARIITAYLDQLAACLPGPAAPRRGILAELHDGLKEAAHSYEATGLSPAHAAHAATAAFGAPHTLAAAFAPELAAARARHTALRLLCTGPLVGLAWLAVVVTSPTAQALPPWRHGLTGVLVALPLVGVAIATAVLAAMATVATTGRLSRWIPHPHRVATTAAATVGGAVIAADLTLLGMLTTQALTIPSALTLAPAVLAGTASLTRLTAAAHALHRV